MKEVKEHMRIERNMRNRNRSRGKIKDIKGGINKIHPQLKYLREGSEGREKIKSTVKNRSRNKRKTAEKKSNNNDQYTMWMEERIRTMRERESESVRDEERVKERERGKKNEKISTPFILKSNKS